MQDLTFKLGFDPDSKFSYNPTSNGTRQSTFDSKSNPDTRTERGSSVGVG